MELDRSKWYVRWFFWSLGIWEEFTERRYDACEEGTNLCFFIRVMLVWAPLVIALHLAIFGLIIYALTAYPIHRFGGSHYGWGVGAIATLVLMIVGINLLRDRIKSRRQRKRNEQYHDYWGAPAPKPRPRSSEPSPSFIEVLLEWIMAKKKLICPRITFTERAAP